MLKKSLILIFALTLIFTIARYSGQAENPSETNIPVQDIADKIISELDLPNMIIMPDEVVELSYPFDKSIAQEFIIYQAMMNICSDELSIFKVNDVNEITTVEKAIEKRLEQLDQIWGFYLPDQYEKVKNHLVLKSGKYIMLAITNDQDKVVEIFNNFMNK